jgi:hypothetical protein
MEEIKYNVVTFHKKINNKIVFTSLEDIKEFSRFVESILQQKKKA